MLFSYFAQLESAKLLLRTCLHKISHASFRQILPMTALNFLDLRRQARGNVPCPRQNSLENLRTNLMKTDSKFNLNVTNPTSLLTTLTGGDNMEDTGIIRLIADRNQTGLAELKKKYGHLILKVCRGLIRSPEDAEECANDTLLAVWNSIPPKEPNDLKAYICRIARRKAINRFQYNTAAMRNADLLTELDECLPSDYSVEGAAELSELTAALNEWLGTLDEKKRRLFIYRYFYMLSVNEAAKSVSLTPTAATTALLRLRCSLKEFLMKREILS